MAECGGGVRWPNRRIAVRGQWRQVVKINGHTFVLNYLKSFTLCGYCSRFLWGVTRSQGYKCLACDLGIHRRCLEFVSFACSGTSLPEGIEPRPHKFKANSYYSPTWCDHCGSMLVRQGLQCCDCDMNVHHHCGELVPKSCGTDLTESRGRIQVSFGSENLDSVHFRIRITIHKCRNLPPMDANGLADPYVKLRLFPELSMSAKQKTEKKEKTLDPVFDETFFFEVTGKEREHRVVMEAWNWARYTANNFIGGFSVSVREIIESEELDSRWYKLLDKKSTQVRYQKVVANVQHGGFQRGSEMVPESRGLPKMTLQDFNLLAVLGKGNTGKVFLAEHKRTKEVFAIKSLKKDLIVQEDKVESTVNERKVLAMQLKPPFLTGLHSCFQTDDHLFFVMEYISGGDLIFHILELGRFPENQTRFYCAEIVLGLLYLHNLGIIYRDLKLENVMLDADGHIKLVSFDLCKEGIKDGNKTRTFCGTQDYIAPEIISYQPYDKSVDWWALGVLTYEMIVGRPPFDGDDDDQLFNNIKEKPVHYPRGISDPAKKIIQGFLTKDPSRRLGCNPSTGEQDIKGHLFFKPIDWDNLAARAVKPPYKPRIEGKKSASNFDPEFTKKPCRLSPVNKAVVGAIEPEVFEGFSFTNPELYRD